MNIYHIGTGKVWQINRFGRLMRMHCTCKTCKVKVRQMVNFMTSGGQTESCQMTVRVLIDDRTDVNC